MAATHFVLVHGSYHRPWHLDLLRTELEKAGYSTSTPALPSVGPGQAFRDAMSADADTIRSAIESAASAATHVVPVFHSYAGIPGSEAVAQLSDQAIRKILRVIYLSAFVLTEGKSCIPLDSPPPPWGAEDKDGLWRYVPDPIVPFYHDVEPALAKECAANCVPQCKSALLEKTRFAGWRNFPTTYILCDDDRAIPLFVQKSFFDALSEEDRKGWSFRTSHGSHSPFLANPAECARMLREIAGEST